MAERRTHTTPASSLFSFTRRNGNARAFLDPLGWKAHRSSWPFVWLARKFRAGSRPNRIAYSIADYIAWHRAIRKFGRLRRVR